MTARAARSAANSHDAGSATPLYVCVNCGLLGPIRDFNDDCTPGWTHGRMIRVEKHTATVRGWLDDIDRALRDVFTSSSDEDEAFDNATRSLDALRDHTEEPTDG